MPAVEKRLNKQKKRSKSSRRKLTKKQRHRRNLILGITIGLVVVLLPIVIVCNLWWNDLLPTREELPRYKERIIIMLSGWQRASLPEADVIGIDISHYQGNINFGELCFHIDNTRKVYAQAGKKTHRMPLSFVIAKSTQGARYQDPYYKAYKQGARENGMLFGAYHFYSYKAGAIAQAEHFIHVAQLQSGDLAPVLDIEPYNNTLPPTDSIYQWLKHIEHYYRLRPVIYTNENTFTQLFLKDKRFDKYHYWIARYGGTEPTRHHIMWQCAENGKAGDAGVMPHRLQ